MSNSPTRSAQEIEHLIATNKGELFDYHNLRTRRAGSQKLIDFHLTVCKHLSVDEAHHITDALEGKIAEHVIGSDVTIHIEPCQQADCPGRARLSSPQDADAKRGRLIAVRVLHPLHG